MSRPQKPTADIPSDLVGWLRLLDSRHPVEIDLGLDRCERVYRRMGAPRPARKIVTVAGTNGKGSTVAYIAAMATALGYRTGSYTSPHILRYNERIVMGGIQATDRQIVEAFEYIEGMRGDISLSYFEFSTLAAFRMMSEADLDYAILEVGLGGRLDAVNIVNCDCAVITPIGIDHQAFLGNDRSSIGHEKAGIIRTGKPVVCGEPQPPASVLDAADHLGAEVFLLERDFHIQAAGGDFVFPRLGICCAMPPAALEGAHQQANRAVAMAAMLLCEPTAKHELSIIAGAAANTALAGRLEVLGACPPVIVDVGHNALAAAAVADYLHHAHPDRLCRCVLGMFADKDAEAVVAALDDQVDEWLCAGLEGNRGQTGTQLALRVAKVSSLQTLAFDSVAQAIDAAIDAARAGAISEDIVLVFGSFGTAADAIRHLGVYSRHGCSDAARIPT